MATCKLGDILLESTEAERRALTLAVADRDNWSAQSLANAINKTRFSVGATTVKDHRREQCGCYQ